MKREFIVNGEITEKEKEKLTETLKYLDTEEVITFEMRYKNSSKEIEVKVTEKQIIANVKKISQEGTWQKKENR